MVQNPNKCCAGNEGPYEDSQIFAFIAATKNFAEKLSAAASTSNAYASLVGAIYRYYALAKV